MNQNEGSPVNVLSENRGDYEVRAKSGSLHPSHNFCDSTCRQCFSHYDCILGYLLEAKRVLFQRFLEAVN